MADNDTNSSYPTFSARLDERISDLSNCLVGPGHLFQSHSQSRQPWQGADISYPATARGDGGGYHSKASQLPSFFTYNGHQNIPANNEDHQGSLGELSGEEKLLQRKRAEAIASLSQKRAASCEDDSGNLVAHGNAGTHSSLNQDSNSTADQLHLAKRSAVSGSGKSPTKEPSATKKNHAGKAGAVEQESHSRQIASAEDIDGLVAEGRVSAAVNAFKPSAKGQAGGEGADNVQRTSVPPIENSPPVANSTAHEHQANHKISSKLGSDNQRPRHSSLASERAGSFIADTVDGNSLRDAKRMTSGQDPRHDHKSYPERRIYEPPKRALTDSSVCHSISRSNDSAPTKCGYSVDTQSLVAMPSNWEVDNEFSKLQSTEVEELREWLQHTGYYDETYRRGKLYRFKRLAALEREKEELMREELLERESLTKHNDRVPYLLTPNHSFDTSSHDLQASPSMPPPPFIPTINTTPSTIKLGDAKRGLKSGTYDEHTFNHSSPSYVSKRQYSDFDNGAQYERAEKMVRTSNGNSKGGLHYEEVPNFMNKERMNLIKDRKFSDGDNSMVGEEDRKFTDQDSAGGCVKNNDSLITGSRHHDDEDQVGSHEGRGGSLTGRGRGRGRGRGGTRGRGRGGFNTGFSRRTSYGELRRSEELNLVAGDVTYFLIKCVAYDMVDAAKKEGTWSTQHKNVEKFTNAFENSRHVVLVFSVNQSGAFQGYARMESRPGAPGVADPSWVKKLGMPLSPPFKISWYNTVETMFRFVGHLKNPYNDNHDVTYARDGQELEPECGRVLCGLLDKTMDYVSVSD